MTAFDDEVARTNTALGTRLRRRVCGRPHKTREAAEHGARAAKAWGWHDVLIEERQYYFVVTGYALGKDVPQNKGGVSNPGLPQRYRWPGK